jgi:protein MpaA
MENERQEVFAYSTEGRPIRGTVLGEGADTYLCFGVIHGNEPAGGPLLERFVKHIEEHPDLIDGKRVVVVPVLNPDGLERNSRTNARGVDLNRNFPSRNWRPSPRHGDAPASEHETRALLRLLRQFQPSRILSIHSPLRCVNFDGPAEGIARNMARASGLPLRSSIGYETPGSLGSYAGDDLLVPTITLELPKSAGGKELWPRLAGALEEFLTTAEPAAGK